MNPLRKVGTAMLPGWIVQCLRLRWGWKWFRGDHASWREALASSVGYDDPGILQAAVVAAQRVRAGEGIWERDGIVFDRPEVNEPLLRALTAAGEAEGRLEVIDFGGALGSTWWQHRDQFTSIGVERWIVVEQPLYVEAGKAFENEVLEFCGTIEQAVDRSQAQVLLCSGALQYLEDPLAMLHRFNGLGFPHVVLDRVPTIRGQRNRLAVQHNPPSLGGRSYPIWLFNEDALLAPLRQAYDQRNAWRGFDRLSADVEFKGYHFTRRQ